MKFISLNVDPTKDMMMSLADGGDDSARTSELNFTITSTLTQPLYLTQSAANAVTVDWGDGSTPDNPSDLAASLSHEYAEAGNYTVKITVAEGETWTAGLTSGSDHYGIIGKYTTKSDTYPTLTSITFKDGAVLGDYAFTQCTGLTSFTIPEGTTSVPQYAFYKCTGITSITIPSGVTSIGAYAFNGCTSITSVTIPSSVTTFGNYAFQSSGLTSVNITDISAWCAITFTSTNNPLSVAKNLYLNGTLVTALEIPSGVTSIGIYAFYGCTSITSVTIGNSVTSIGSSAFNGCTSITSVTIGNSVTSIDNQAFYMCKGLTSITSENTTPPTINNATFAGAPAACSIYVPAASVDTYKAAQYWSERADYIQAISA